jgi:hypothetical protein
LPRWQYKQALAISVMALAICGQQNRAVMRWRVASTLGWCMECSDWKTASLCWMGTRGRATPVETSPSRESSPTGWVGICSVVEFIISATSGQDHCAAAIAEKSTGCASVMAAPVQPGLPPASPRRWGREKSAVLMAAAVGRRLKTSATTFSCPGVCLMSDLNSAMKDNCLCWRADQGGVVRNKDVTSGLW